MDLERIEALLKLMQEYGVAEIGVEDESSRIELRMQGAAVAVAAPVAVAPVAAPVAAQSPAAPAAPADDGVSVEAPMVGTFYRSSKPGARPFVEVGERVSKGQVLCIIEAMKLMNELEAEVSGTVVEILVENGEGVQFGQALFRIRPD
ncbi:MAG: acetyl-CoA carboxylase biotin carboxyl carrier protein [Alphaproteobacteria bacterium]|nr:acetyl-CoA carboxylase biotin carboxyl carrier protein [Alphaproteobacteria bacterium]